jgi:hypothetical protein
MVLFTRKQAEPELYRLQGPRGFGGKDSPPDRRGGRTSRGHRTALAGKRTLRASTAQEDESAGERTGSAGSNGNSELRHDFPLNFCQNMTLRLVTLARTRRMAATTKRI